MLYQVWIVNKAGSLIYSRGFNQEKLGNIKALSSNDAIVLASTLHSLTAISARIAPSTAPSQGIRKIETDLFHIFIFSTVTGTKFMAMTDLSVQSLEPFFKRLYETYTDYVLKNAFYTLENPIRCAQFDKELDKSCLSIK